MAAQLRQLRLKASQASDLLLKRGTAYYKQLIEQNKHYVQEPATVEKCNELSKQLFYTRLASIPRRKEAFWKELDQVKRLWKDRKELHVEQVGIATLFGLECFVWFCAGARLSFGDHTRTSQAVTHPGTTPARARLTAESPLDLLCLWVQNVLCLVGCSNRCVAENCNSMGIRYGKYCGVGWTGCLGEKPCDDLDACCQIHDDCVEKKGMTSVKCHEKFKRCIKRVHKSGKAGFSNDCPYDTAVPTMQQGMDMAILFSQFGNSKLEL